MTNITLGRHGRVGYRRLPENCSNPLASSQFDDGPLKRDEPAATSTAGLQEYLAAPKRM